MPPVLVKITKTRDRDPTLETPTIKRFFKEIEKRFNILKVGVWKYVVTDDLLRPQVETVPATAPLVMASYEYERSAEKSDEFMHWLDQMVEEHVLTVEYRPDFISPAPIKLWSDVYVLSAYQSGIAQARRDLSGIGAKIPDQGPVSTAFHQPFHADRVALAYTRTFNGMKGLTDAMKSQMSRVLAQGMAEGRGITHIARQLQDRVEKIGKTRARLIARTEIIQAHNEAAINEFKALENIVGEEIKVQWWTALDERVRPRHSVWHGKIYTKKKARTMLGEPNCLLGTAMCYSPSCVERTFERFYDGPFVILNCASGNQLTCTPNHPILTINGFFPAGLLNVNDTLLNCRMPNDPVSISTEKQNIKATMKDIASSFSLPNHITSSSRGIPLNFHGDGINDEITIIRSDSELWDDFGISEFFECFSNKKFSFGSMQNFFGSRYGAAFSDFLRVYLSSSFGMREVNLIRSLFRRHMLPFNKFGFSACSESDVLFNKSSINNLTRTAKIFSKLVNGSSGEIFFDKLIDIQFKSEGVHVYNLQTKDGFYCAVDFIDQNSDKVNYYITGNCRCTLLPWTKKLAEIRQRFNISN